MFGSLQTVSKSLSKLRAEALGSPWGMFGTCFAGKVEGSPILPHLPPPVWPEGSFSPLYVVNVLHNLASLFLVERYPQLPAKWKNGQQITRQVCMCQWRISHWPAGMLTLHFNNLGLGDHKNPLCGGYRVAVNCSSQMLHVSGSEGFLWWYNDLHSATRSFKQVTQAQWQSLSLFFPFKNHVFRD